MSSYDHMIDDAVEIIRDMNKEQLEVVRQALDEKWRELELRKSFLVRATLVAGDTVSWESRRNGKRVQGEVVKVMRSRAIVKVIDGLQWIVPLSMLKIEKRDSDASTV